MILHIYGADDYLHFVSNRLYIVYLMLSFLYCLRTEESVGDYYIPNSSCNPQHVHKLQRFIAAGKRLFHPDAPMLLFSPTLNKNTQTLSRIWGEVGLWYTVYCQMRMYLSFVTCLYNKNVQCQDIHLSEVDLLSTKHLVSGLRNTSGLGLQKISR